MLKYFMAFIKRINISPQFILAYDQKKIYDKGYVDLRFL